MRKRITNRTDFVTTNILEAGLMRGADAARFMGISRHSFHQTHKPKMTEFLYEGQTFFSFLEVFERALKNDLNFNTIDIEKAKAARQVQHVQRLDLIKTKLKNTK